MFELNQTPSDSLNNPLFLSNFFLSSKDEFVVVKYLLSCSPLLKGEVQRFEVFLVKV